MSSVQKPPKTLDSSVKGSKEIQVLQIKLDIKDLNFIGWLRICTFKEVIFQNFFVSFQFVYLFLLATNKEGFSIYGKNFADESFHIPHTEPGLLGMCKKGNSPHTNEC